jgi:hypothetical protein
LLEEQLDALLPGERRELIAESGRAELIEEHRAEVNEGDLEFQLLAQRCRRLDPMKPPPTTTARLFERASVTACAAVHGDCGRPEVHVDVVRAVKALVFDVWRLGLFAAQVLLGQRGAVVGQGRLVADERDAALAASFR